jgi:hypothetical protein
MSGVADCCARAAIGQAIADPRPAMNSLRRIVHAPRAILRQDTAVELAWKQISDARCWPQGEEAGNAALVR